MGISSHLLKHLMNSLNLMLSFGNFSFILLFISSSLFPLLSILGIPTHLTVDPLALSYLVFHILVTLFLLDVLGVSLFSNHLEIVRLISHFAYSFFKESCFCFMDVISSQSLTILIE